MFLPPLPPPPFLEKVFCKLAPSSLLLQSAEIGGLHHHTSVREREDTHYLSAIEVKVQRWHQIPLGWKAQLWKIFDILPEKRPS